MDFKDHCMADWSRYRIVAGFVTSSSPVPLKTCRVGQGCTLNLSRAETSSRWCAKRNRRVTSTRVTSMVTASIGKAISAATVRRRLHMNGLYFGVPRVCIPLSVQSRGARLRWCREHGN
ncbi:transposable element Tc1 transposase [Trichonephila clavipes]|nr:transposable element Tc1 transposase [Trichonephila clavipes]